MDEEESLRAIQDVVKDEKGKGKALEDADLLMLCAWVFEQTGQGGLRLYKARHA